VCGAATENARRANSVRVLAADSIGASEDRRGRTEQRAGSGRLGMLASTTKEPLLLLWASDDGLLLHTFSCP